MGNAFDQRQVPLAEYQAMKINCSKFTSLFQENEGKRARLYKKRSSAMTISQPVFRRGIVLVIDPPRPTSSYVIRIFFYQSVD